MHFINLSGYLAASVQIKPVGPFTSYSEILVGNRNFFLPPCIQSPPYGLVPGTIAVNVTRLERKFNACKTPRCIYPSTFNRFPVIQA